jgi:hypothetical protein
MYDTFFARDAHVACGFKPIYSRMWGSCKGTRLTYVQVTLLSCTT